MAGRNIGMIERVGWKKQSKTCQCGNGTGKPLPRRRGAEPSRRGDRETKNNRYFLKIRAGLFCEIVPLFISFYPIPSIMKDLISSLAVRPLLCDGAMGTQLIAAGHLKPGVCGMLMNYEQPHYIRHVHDAYRKAGCDMLTTNTFGGTAHVLAGFGLENYVEELNKAGAQIAREAAGRLGWVLGNVGPFGDFLEPVGDMTVENLYSMFLEQIKALIEGGSDAILIETMSEPAEAEVAVAAARTLGDFPLIVTFAFQKSGENEFRTMMGTSVEETVQRSIAAGAHIVGANCGTELTFPDYIELAKQIVAVAGRAPVLIQPNAGSPQTIGDSTFYSAKPEEMAALVPSLLDAGVRIIGGCCGTTPDHLAAMCRAL
jgi:5-methyltetrahydrofolate--homocysteine methyltransferase